MNATEIAQLRKVPGPSALGGGWRRFFDLLWLIAVNNFKVTYVGAVRTLEVRPLRRRRAELTLRLRRTGLAPDEQDALIQERRRLDDEISSKYPEEGMKRHLRRGDVDAR